MNTAQSPTTSPSTPVKPPKPYLPDDPATTTTSDADDALLGAFICSTEPISEFIREHNISMHELVRWCRRDDIAQVIDAVTKLHEARAKLQIIMAAHDAVITLKFIAMTQRPTSAQEISRRAANTLLKLAFPEVKPTSRPVSSPTPPTPPATPPPSSPPSKPRHLDTSTPSAPSVPLSPCPSVPSPSSPPTPSSGAGVPPASTQPTSSPSSSPPSTIPPPPSAAPSSPSNAPPAKSIRPQTHPSPDRLETEAESRPPKQKPTPPPHEDG